MPGRVKSPNVVGVLLSEPDVPLRIYGDPHDTVLSLGRGPGGNRPRVCIEAGKLVVCHLAEPDVSLLIHRR